MTLMRSLWPVAMLAAGFVALDAAAQPTADKPELEGQWENSNKSYTGRALEKYWYCPAVKFIAKSSFQFDQSWRDRPARSETRQSELTKFTPAP